MKIRNVTFSDLKQISDLEATCCPLDGATYNDFVDFYENKSVDDFLEVIVSDQNQDEVLGFIGFQFQPEDRSCYIWNLAVFPNYRKSGLAIGLVKHSIEIAKLHSLSKIFLEVAESNQGAIALYKKLSFVEKAYESNYYENGEGCFRLEYKID